MGDLNNGTFTTGLAFQNVPVDDDQPAVFAYLVVSQAESLIFADCDGPVAAGVHVFVGSQLRATTHNGGVLQTTDNNPGTDSAAGCGSNSSYNVTWKIARSATAHNLKFAATTARADESFQWWYGLTGDQVGQKVQASNMQLRNLSAYVGLDDSVKFVAVLGPSTGEWWWWARPPSRSSRC